MEQPRARKLSSYLFGGFGGTVLLSNVVALLLWPDEILVQEAVGAIAVGGVALVTATLAWRDDPRARWLFVCWAAMTVVGHYLVVAEDLRRVVWPGYIFAGCLIVAGFRFLSRDSVQSNETETCPIALTARQSSGGERQARRPLRAGVGA